MQKTEEFNSKAVYLLFLRTGTSLYYSEGEVRGGFEFFRNLLPNRSDLMLVFVMLYREQLLRLLESDYVAISEIFPATRGGLKGKAMFYRSSPDRMEYYEEHLELASGQILEVLLAFDVTDETNGKIEDLFGDPTVKNIFCINLDKVSVLLSKANAKRFLHS